MDVPNRSTWLFWWILANTLGSIIGLILGFYIAILLDFSNLEYFIFVLAISLPIGLAQSLVIRKTVNIYLWLILTTLGLSLGLSFSSLILLEVSVSNLSLLSLLLILLLIGSAIGNITGLFQWLLLRAKYSNAGLWIFTSTIAYATSFLVFFGLGFFSFVKAPPIGIVFCIFSFVANGWITGKTMQHISFQSLLAKKNKKSID